MVTCMDPMGEMSADEETTSVLQYSRKLDGVIYSTQVSARKAYSVLGEAGTEVLTSYYF
jgi:hypothetical protein